MPAGEPLRLPADESPVLLPLVVVEEEFDWSEPFRRDAVSVRAVPLLERAQAWFDEAGALPIYLVDYPVADDPGAAEVVRGLAATGRARIGAHLHAWVTPPYEEVVSDHNSFSNNLEPELEGRKIHRLVERVEEVFGEKPLLYQAGRYGIGAQTPTFLRREGIAIDLSPSPPFDYSFLGGPDYSHFPVHPAWLDEPGGVLSIPITGAFVGFLNGAGPRMYRFARSPRWRWTKLEPILSRVGAIERIRLSPEGFRLKELQRLTRHLLERGVRVFTLTFHSPSLMPGCTPYVQDARDLANLESRIRGYLAWFLGELGGVSIDPLQLRERFGAQLPRR